MKKKMLVVDDEKGMRDMIRFILASDTYVVEEAENGLAAIEIIKQQVFDVVFLDIHMPVMGGYEALSIIRKIKPELKVIIFSSSSDPNFILETKAKALGAVDCLYKPFNLEDVMRAIEKAFSGEGEESHGTQG
jgi:CheY-like chemotaxis protein